jgi:hypothetical protein
MRNLATGPPNILPIAEYVRQAYLRWCRESLPSGKPGRTSLGDSTPIYAFILDNKLVVAGEDGPTFRCWKWASILPWHHRYMLVLGLQIEQSWVMRTTSTLLFTPHGGTLALITLNFRKLPKACSSRLHDIGCTASMLYNRVLGNQLFQPSFETSPSLAHCSEENATL